MSRHEFPKRPIPAVGEIVFRGSQVLLVRRRDPPYQGRWSVPGGAIEVGETVEQAVIRETREETAVDVRPVEVITVGDFVEKQKDRVRWHYVLVDLLCLLVRGDPDPGSDATNAGFIELRELAEFDVVPSALEVIERSIARRGRTDARLTVTRIHRVPPERDFAPIAFVLHDVPSHHLPDSGLPGGIRRLRHRPDSRICRAEGSRGALAHRGGTGAFTSCRRVILARRRAIGRASGLSGGRHIESRRGMDLGGPTSRAPAEPSHSLVAVSDHGRRTAPREGIRSGDARGHRGAREPRGRTGTLSECLPLELRRASDV